MDYLAEVRAVADEGVRHLLRQGKGDEFSAGISVLQPPVVPDGKPGIIGSVLHTLSPVSVHNLSVSGQKFPGIRAGLSIYSILQPDYNFLYSAKAVRTRCRNPVCPRENEWFFLTNIPLRDSIISKYLFVRFLQAACQ